MLIKAGYESVTRYWGDAVLIELLSLGAQDTGHSDKETGMWVLQPSVEFAALCRDWNEYEDEIIKEAGIIAGAQCANSHNVPMCGRFSLFADQSTLEDRFGAEAAEPIEPRYNIAPLQELNVVPNDDSEHFDKHQWGFRPDWWDESKGRPPINARGETVAEKPMFRAAFRERRCPVIADGFYEWQGEPGSKRPFRIERSDDAPFAFAGIWRPYSENGDEIDTAAIITTEPNETVSSIHDRMPVMLEPDEEETWLASDDESELLSVLDPYPDGLTAAFEVTTKVNDPGYDAPDLLERIGHDQSGLGEFG